MSGGGSSCAYSPSWVATPSLTVIFHVILLTISFLLHEIT
jgi:hypothetical protein